MHHVILRWCADVLGILHSRVHSPDRTGFKSWLHHWDRAPSNVYRAGPTVGSGQGCLWTGCPLNIRTPASLVACLCSNSGWCGVINNNKRSSRRPILFSAHTKTETEPLGAGKTILQALLLLRPIKNTSRGLLLSCSLGGKAFCKVCKWPGYIFFCPNYSHLFQTEWGSFIT